MKHTPEPWAIYYTENTGLPSDPCPCVVIGQDGLSPKPEPQMTICVVTDKKSFNATDAANVKRIVACVNACAGMEDPERDIWGLRHDLADYIAMFHAQSQKIKELKAELERKE
jgi:hypothetical protein